MLPRSRHVYLFKWPVSICEFNDTVSGTTAVVKQRLNNWIKEVRVQRGRPPGGCTVSSLSHLLPAELQASLNSRGMAPNNAPSLFFSPCLLLFLLRVPHHLPSLPVCPQDRDRFMGEAWHLPPAELQVKALERQQTVVFSDCQWKHVPLYVCMCMCVCLWIYSFWRLFKERLISTHN